MILHNNVLGRFLILIGLILVIAQPVISIEKDRIYQVFLKYSDNNISLDSIIVTVGFYDKNPIQQGDYQAELISFSEEILYTIYFDFNLETSASALPEWFDEDGTQIYFPGKSLTLNETTEQVIIPYFSNGKKINIYDLYIEKKNYLYTNVLHMSKFLIKNILLLMKIKFGSDFKYISWHKKLYIFLKKYEFLESLDTKSRFIL